MKHLALLALPLLVLACTEKSGAPEAQPAEAQPAEAKPAEAKPAGDVIAGGTIKLPEGAKPRGEAVFISLRDPKGGPPVAAKKLPPGPFPMKFTITEADKIAMGQPRPIPDAFMLKVKLDTDGNAMTTAAGELQETRMVVKGSSQIEFELKPSGG